MMGALAVSLPLLLWMIGFSGIYGLHGATCATGGTPLSVGLPAVVAVTAALQIGLLAWILLGAPRRLPTFQRRLSRTLAFVASAATLWTGVPVFVLPLCA